MTTYLIGDIQGCYQPLRQVLQQADFQPEKDSLWSVGDLVNRGGQSAEVLEYLYTIRHALTLVLGNHDLYMLRLMACKNASKLANLSAELRAVLLHPQVETWYHWLRSQPLIHYDSQRNTVLVHAGIPHIWTLQQALRYCRQAERELRSSRSDSFLRSLFGNQPEQWHPQLRGYDRLRCIVNYVTRMRFINQHGVLDLATHAREHSQPQEYKAWFTYQRAEKDIRIAFGHWAALQGNASGSAVHAVACDSGCVWGGQLTLFDIDSNRQYAVRCR